MGKTIIRLCYETKKKEEFYCTGVWADGHYSYSKITLNEKGEKEVKEEDDSTYYQRRIDGKLVMIHA